MLSVYPSVHPVVPPVCPSHPVMLPICPSHLSICSFHPSIFLSSFLPPIHPSPLSSPNFHPSFPWTFPLLKKKERKNVGENFMIIYWGKFWGQRCRKGAWVHSSNHGERIELRSILHCCRNRGTKIDYRSGEASFDLVYSPSLTTSRIPPKLTNSQPPST